MLVTIYHPTWCNIPEDLTIMHIYVAVTKMYRLFSKIVYYKKNYTDVILELGQVLGVAGEFSDLGSSTELGQWWQLIQQIL